MRRVDTCGFPASGSRSKPYRKLTVHMFAGNMGCWLQVRPILKITITLLAQWTNPQPMMVLGTCVQAFKSSQGWLAEYLSMIMGCIVNWHEVVSPFNDVELLTCAVSA